MFKNRMIGIIFAIEMSRHTADIKEINQLLAIDVNSEGELKSLITMDRAEPPSARKATM